jgi:hypothetical protein
MPPAPATDTHPVHNDYPDADWWRGPHRALVLYMQVADMDAPGEARLRASAQRHMDAVAAIQRPPRVRVAITPTEPRADDDPPTFRVEVQVLGNRTASMEYLDVWATCSLAARVVGRV